MSFLDHCRRLVALESTPSHGNLSAAEFVGSLCEEAGLHVEYQREALEGVEQCNVIARPQKDTPAREFLLQTHLDTVHAGHFSQWTQTQSNPFNASIYNDVMYGLGTADAKLDFLCKLEAIKAFVGRPMKMPFVLVATFGAQNGMAGAIKLIRRKKLQATQALIGEPTDMRLVHAGTGMAVVEIDIPYSEEEKIYRRDHDLLESTSTQSKMFAGKAAHSSDPKLGENAIMKMMEYLAHLPDGVAVMDLDGGIDYNTVPAHALLEIDMVAGFKDPILPKISRIYEGLRALESDLRGFREDGFQPPHPTMNLGNIRTSNDEIRITGSCRLPPSVTDAIYEGWMKKLAAAVQSVGATFRVKDYRKGFTTAPETAFAQGTQDILHTMGLNSSLHKMAVSSEANVFTRMGVECLVWGPGQSVGNSHAPNENVRISDLKTAVGFYRQMIERFCF
ncbi:MAG: M20/M25/M40 family metallo-hydrolase [Bdellovibrionales bacterium]|nr:M20/M25/M40 family metallo-hydrolase [Bdellovibrionales bacterium]